MKHFLLKTILPAFLLLGAASLTACNKLPSSNYEKVKFAFNGVEKTFKDPKTAKKSLSLAKRERLGGSNTDAGLSTIFNLYTQEDKRNDFLEDVGYDQTPMVQFQYIKKVLETIRFQDLYAISGAHRPSFFSSSLFCSTFSGVSVLIRSMHMAATTKNRAGTSEMWSLIPIRARGACIPEMPES